MLFLLLCGVLFVQLHGYNIPNLPSVHGAETLHETGYPARNHGQNGHTYEPVNTNNYEDQPEISYHSFNTFETRPEQVSLFQQYPWLMQWRQMFGLAQNDGSFDSFGFRQRSHDIFGGDRTGNGPENPSQETAQENQFRQASNPGEDIDDNSQAAETISKPPPGETDDDSEPPPFPDTSDDDDSDPGESSGDEPPKYLDEPPKYIDETEDTNASSDKNSNISVVTPEGINSEGKNNTTTPRPPRPRPMADPTPGTMSRPVPKLGLLFAPSLQWHVGIYSKTFTPYMQVCGGSLVKADVVLSAAHCFWDDDVGALRPGLFAAAAGKLLRPWETEGEIYTQHSDIKDIKIPPRFRGSRTSFQDDIAIVFLTRSLEYAPGVKPVCISFDMEMDRRHLTSGNLGKIAGWGLTEPNGLPSQRLNYLELPYVDIEECVRTADDSFLRYITSDKICAGDQKTGRALCRGDSGGGLIYYTSTIPYLHGIVSTAPRDNNKCNAYAVASFTHVQAHRRFLIGHVPGLGEGCEELYVNRTGVGQNDTGIKPENASLTPSGISQAQEEDRISTNFALESGISNVSGPQMSLTEPSQNDTNGEAKTNNKNEGSNTGDIISNSAFLTFTSQDQDVNNEESNTKEPLSLTVPSQNNTNEGSITVETITNPTVSNQGAINEESNTGEPISLKELNHNDDKGVSNIVEPMTNPTVSRQDVDNEESNTREAISLTVPDHNDEKEVSNTGEQITNPTVSSQDAKKEESNTGEPISLTVTNHNDEKGVSNIGEPITNPTVTRQDADNGESNSGEPISLTVSNYNDEKRVSNTEEQITNPTIYSQEADNEKSNTGAPIFLTVTNHNDEKGVSSTGKLITNETVSNQNDGNEMSNSEERISLAVPNQSNNNRESDSEIQTSNLTASQADKRPIGEMNGNEKEVVMNVERGEREVARISVDNITRTFVCNCYCKN